MLKKARRLFIAGNWKMHHNAAAARQQLETLKAKVAGVKTVDIAVCPTFTSLAAAAAVAAGSNVKIGAQNVHWAEKGAFTGEIAAAMLKEIPVTYVIVGHSERRQYFGETDETVSKRLQAALAAGLLPIVCCGEVLAQRQASETEAVVTTQIVKGLAGLKPEDMAKVTLAYEPVWAIGTGVTATPDQAQDVHALIRGLLKKNFGDTVAKATRIQYGGSVKVANVAELMAKPDIDGALVGGASLEAVEFAQLVIQVS
jgi:triosephosphate isomerase (TIM)